MDIRPETCSVCHDLEKCNLVISPKDLERTSDHRCSRCEILDRGIHTLVKDFDEVKELQLVTDSSLFANVVRNSNEQASLESVEFYTVDPYSAATSNIGPARHVSTNSSEDECVALAGQWLKSCLSSHSSCQRAGTPKLPTRVISVGTCEDEVKLETNTTDIHAEYVALSHVWGGLLPTRLVASTLEEMQQKVGFNDDSKTLQEAVDVTRRLGIPYIWIDSLCIIQAGDCGEDWNREAPKMSEIYNNATLTISAGASKSSATGLFPRRQDRNGMNQMITIHEPESGSTVYARFRNGDVFSTRETVHSSSPLEPPQIRSRGWVLQEDLLSPRVLQFRKEEMTWICSTYSYCECRIRPSLPPPHPFRRARGLSPQVPQQRENLVIQWPSIVMDYTRRNLTQPQDLMMALAGLADYMESETDDTYYGGLWYGDIAFGLLWISDQTEGARRIFRLGLASDKSEMADMLAVGPLSTTGSRFPIPYAPSWSWTSISGPISYYQRYPLGSAPSHPATKTNDAVDPLLMVINLVRVPLRDTFFGPLRFCSLFAAGAILPISYNRSTNLWVPQYQDGTIDDLDPSNLIFHIDVPEEDPTVDEEGQYALILVGRWRGQGLTITSMQAVCILARRVEIVMFPYLVRRFFQHYGVGEQEMLTLPDLENSYTRVGLVRGAGSIEAWNNGGHRKLFFLF